ncbi:MAG: ParB N-terminal domain-containing protein [Desulfobacter sp.]|nr:ParB N-terminal domain-containing protein [Desulfobacter sp.]WDP86344.1 MAG: ParB N-terminal domain-containing protein [Desulfobacter sp.]
MNDIDHATIPVSAINPADTGFRITSPEFDIPGLALSISQIGLTTPPLILEKDQGYVMVSGFRRFEAVISLGWEKIHCRIMRANTQDSMLNAAMNAVAQNAFQRPLDPGELIRAVHLLGQYMDDTTLAQKSSALFNMSLNVGYLKTLAAIYRLPSQALSLLDKGQLSIKSAKAITRFDMETAKAFLTLFSKIHISSGKQMEIMTLAREIAALENTTVQDLFNASKLLKANDLCPPSGHKDLAALGNRIRASLLKQRFPELEQARQKAGVHLKKLKLDQNLKLILPENFESMIYSIHLGFTSRDDFKERLKTLETLLDHPDFIEILNR